MINLSLLFDLFIYLLLKFEFIDLQERKPSEPIPMVPINDPSSSASSGEEDSKENYSADFTDMMTSLSNSHKLSSSGDNNNRKQTSGDLQTFCKTLAKMRLTPERVAKVVKDRIFSVTVHPSVEKLLVCAGDKWGKVGLWDVVRISGNIFLYKFWLIHFK